VEPVILIEYYYNSVIINDNKFIFYQETEVSKEKNSKPFNEEEEVSKEEEEVSKEEEEVSKEEEEVSKEEEEVSKEEEEVF